MKNLFLTLIALLVIAGNAYGQAASTARLMGLGVPSSQAAEIAKLGTLKTMTVTDNDAQDNTLGVAEVVGGITVHTSTTGGGTVTTDTAANIIAGSGSVVLAANNDCITSIYVNDGDQVLTFAGGDSVTVSDTGQTLAANESALLFWCRASSSTVTLHIIGA